VRREARIFGFKPALTIPFLPQRGTDLTRRAGIFLMTWLQPQIVFLAVPENTRTADAAGDRFGLVARVVYLAFALLVPRAGDEPPPTIKGFTIGKIRLTTPARFFVSFRSHDQSRRGFSLARRAEGRRVP